MLRPFCTCSAFLFRDQFILRGLILVGNLVYILYFYFAPESPLWGGIFWSAMFTIVNVDDDLAHLLRRGAFQPARQ